MPPLEPIFITGCGKSGTTIVFRTLRQHKDLAPTTGYPDGEDHVGWIKFGKCKMSGIGNINSENYGDGVTGSNNCPSMTKDDASEDIINTMNQYYLHIAQNSKRVLNKNPHISNKLDYVSAIFPAAKFVHIVRDCYPMIESWKNVINQHKKIMAYLPPISKNNYAHALSFISLKHDFNILDLPQGSNSTYPGSNGEPFAHYWLNINRLAIQYGLNNPNKLILIKLEDFTVNPTKELNKLREFLNLEDFKYDTSNINLKRANINHKNYKGQVSFDHALTSSLEELRFILGYH